MPRGKTSTAVMTTVAATTGSASVLAANPARAGAIIFNNSTTTAFIAYGTVASATTYTQRIAAGGYYEMVEPVYTGAISAIWSAGTGGFNVTEL